MHFQRSNLVVSTVKDAQLMHQLMLSFCKGSEPLNREFIELGIFNREPEVEEDDDSICLDDSF